MEITFLLNGERVELRDVDPTVTTLDWLRERRGLTGTKEGCNEGDCGACTVMMRDEGGVRAVNACILFLPQLHGKALRTIEGMAAADGTLHPVQQAMVDHHGSQCGFCTPGFVVSMAVAQERGQADHDDVLAGNLCRCTGYAPIIRAAEAAAASPAPDWVKDDLPDVGPAPFAPANADDLAAWYLDNPDATLVAGATDVGLWVTKQLRDLPKVAFLHACADLQGIDRQGDRLRIGAGVTVARLRDAVQQSHPAFAELLRRFASEQVRATATIGGNIANGSPIGDAPPALIAMGATLHLRRGDTRREMPLEDFFLAYGKQDRQQGEFVEAVTIPATAPDLACHKLSKRFDQDISAVCGCFDIRVSEGIVTAARVAFGGMAATPKRALAVEAALTGAPFTEDGIGPALAAFETDFAPISDMRASAAYRMEAARAMLIRTLRDRQGEAANLLAVAP